MKMCWGPGIARGSSLLLLVWLWVLPAFGATYHVSKAGNDTTGNGSAGNPWLTIQHAVNQAFAGDQINVGSGVFTERLTFPRSGTSSARITVQGAGATQTIVDGSSATSDWVAAPEVGTGVYKRVLGYQPYSLTSNGKMIQKISNRAMDGELLFNVNQTGFQILARSSTSTIGTALGTVQFWDGVEALAGYLASNSTTYLRFRTNVDPDTMNVRAAPTGGVLTLTGRSYITIKQLRVVGGHYGIHISGGGNHVIEQCEVQHGDIRIKLDTGTTANQILNNTITQNGLHTTTYMSGDHNVSSYARIVMRHQYNIDKFYVGETTERGAAIELHGTPTNTLIQGNTISQGANGVREWQSSGTHILNNTFFFHGAEAMWPIDGITNHKTEGNLFYDNEHHIRIQNIQTFVKEMYIFTNRFYQPLPDDSGKHIHFSMGCGTCTTPAANLWIYHNSFAGGGWATDVGGTSEGTQNLPNLRILNNVNSVRGWSSGGFHQVGEMTGNLVNSLWRTASVPPTFVLPTTLRNQATSLIPRSLPGMTTGYYADGLPDHGAIQGDLEAPPPTITPGVGLDITHTCASSTNSLAASVLGSLWYLLPGQIYDAPTLVQASCASNVALTDVASVLQSGFPAVRPFHFLAQGVSPSGNTCTNCLAVHNGLATSIEGGSGWTAPGLLEDTTVSAATGGESAFLALPGLCKRYVDGVLTNDPLWPWPMQQRIIDARTAASKSPVNVTSLVETLFGPLPEACTTTTPLPPPPATQTTWFIATDGVDGQACTLAAPCATLAHVAGRMGRGHTVYLRAGTYAQKIDSLTAPLPGGISWDQPTTIAAYEQEAVTLQMPTFILAWFRNPLTDHYLIVDRLTFDGTSPPSTETTGMAFEEGTHHIRIQNCRFQQMRFSHVIVNGGDHIQLLDNTFTDNAEVSALHLMGTIDSLVVQGNTIANSAEHGMETGEGTFTNSRLTRNIITNVTGSGLSLGAGAQGLVVANNLLHGNTTGIHLRTQAAQTRVYNNTVADNTGTGLQIDPGATDTRVTNNILFGNDTELIDNGTATVLTTNLMTNPGFVGGGDYRLASPSSPAVDTGTTLPSLEVGPEALDGTARVQGAGQDMGAYEQAGTPPLPAPGPLNARPWGAHLMLPVPY